MKRCVSVEAVVMMLVCSGGILEVQLEEDGGLLLGEVAGRAGTTSTPRVCVKDVVDCRKMVWSCSRRAPLRAP